MKEAFIKLHLSILLAGGTGIFGKLISLSEFMLVWYRMLFAAILFLLVLKVSGSLRRVTRHDVVKIGAVGILLALHWVFFYGSIKMSNVSIGVVCLSLMSFFTALFTGLAICILGEIFLTPLATLLGSSPTILPYAKDYLGVILLGAPWMTASLVLNNQLRFQGNAIYGTIGIVSGAVLNIGLDPLLIFTFDMSVAGAAWATIISQFASFCLLLAGCTRGGNLHIQFSRFQLKWSYFKLIIQGGLPSLARQSLASVATICLNHAAMPYGDAAIAAMGVVQRITTFGASAMIGFGQGFQPVCGFNYGAQLYHRVREGFWFCVKVATVFLLAAGAVGFVFAPQLIALFRDDPEVISIGTVALRFQCVTFFFQGWITMSNMMLQTIGRTVPATFIAIPNTAVAVGCSMTFITPVSGGEEAAGKVEAIFNAVGSTLVVDERLLAAGTKLASCGIAYAMRYVRASTEGGVELGFKADAARDIVLQTVKGAVALLQESGAHPEAEIDKVTTPGGLTIRGLNAMERAGFTNAVIRGLMGE